MSNRQYQLIAIIVLVLAILYTLLFNACTLKSDWDRVDIDNGWSLRGIWGSSSNDIYAVGRGGTILHYDGTAWSGGQIWDATEDYLYDIWGSSSSDVFAVGDGGAIIHYNGNSWSEMESGHTDTLYGIWGSSSEDVYAVGNNGAILHYDGDTWSEMESGTINDIADIWGSSSEDAFSVVRDGHVLRHRDGNTWSYPAFGCELVSIWGSSSSDIFFSGRYIKRNREGNTYYVGTIFHYDGNTWSEMECDTTLVMRDIWGSSATNVFAVGNAGYILHYDGISQRKL